MILILFSGKTFTVQAENGLIPTTISQLFSRIQDDKDNEYSVFLSYLQIYHERIYDLLESSRETDLHLREHPNEGRKCRLLAQGNLSFDGLFCVNANFRIGHVDQNCVIPDHHMPQYRAMCLQTMIATIQGISHRDLLTQCNWIRLTLLHLWMFLPLNWGGWWGVAFLSLFLLLVSPSLNPISARSHFMAMSWSNHPSILT